VGDGEVSLTELPRLDVSFYSAEVVADPYPLFERIRGLGRAVDNGTLGIWMLTGYDDCDRVLSAPTEFSVLPVAQESGNGSALEGFGPGSMVHLDGEAHARLRRVWAAAFVPKSLEAVRAFVQESVGEALDGVEQRLRDGEAVDAFADVCRGVPTTVIGRLLGVDPALGPEIERWSDDLMLDFETIGDVSPEADEKRAIARTGFRALGDFLLDEVRRRRRRPADDLVGLIAAVPGLSDEDVVANLRSLVIGGNETTGKLMSNLVVALAEHADARRRIAAEPSLAPAAVEEALRWQAVAQFDLRVVRADGTEVAGTPAPAGTVVGMLLGAANRDPERWERPEAFDIRRPPQQHLGFGRGPHTCIGLHLARLETSELIRGWLARFPEYELAGEVDYGANFTVRGPKSAPVVLGRAARSGR
jgi:cytochrome P450